MQGPAASPSAPWCTQAKLTGGALWSELDQEGLGSGPSLVSTCIPNALLTLQSRDLPPGRPLQPHGTLALALM